MEAAKGWSVVTGRQGPRRGAFRGGYRGGSKGAGFRPKKRPRVSAESAGSPSKVESPTHTSKTFSLNTFKSLSIDDKLETMFACLLDVKATNERLLKAERTVNEMRETTQVNKRRINVLAYKSIDIESRQRRNNLIFWGLPEVLNKDCNVVISEFLCDKLGLDSEAICIQRAHRIGKPQRRQTVIGRSVRLRHRPLIVAFRDFQDVELILSNASKLQGTSFGINRDYPQEIVEARKALMKERKELKAKYPNSQISVQYPAKLIQDGRLVKDMFPDWYSFIKSDRLNDSLYGRTRSENPRVDHSERVFESDSESSVNDIETEGTVMQTQAQIHNSPSPRAQVSAASIFGSGKPQSNERSTQRGDTACQRSGASNTAVVNQSRPPDYSPA